MPRLLTRMSTKGAASRSVAAPPAVAASARTPFTWAPPAARMFAAASSSFARVRPAIVTVAPSTASLRAIARPIPPVDPVMSAVFPFSCRSMAFQVELAVCNCHVSSAGICVDSHRIHMAIDILELLSLRELLRVRDPAAAHRLVETRVRLEELRLRRDVGELGVEEGLLCVGDFKVDRRAFPVAQGGEVAESLQCRDVARLGRERLRELAAVDQGVLHLLKRDDDRFLVAGKRLAPESLALRDLVADASGVEDWKAHAGPVRPRSRRALEEIRELAALHP